jgi:hypothetical protein
MTSIGLVANNYTITDPITLDQSNINYTNSLISCDKDVLISTAYLTLSSLPANVVPVSGLVNNAVTNLQTQINNINIPSNTTVINNVGSNLYTVSGTIGLKNIQMVKVKYY